MQVGDLTRAAAVSRAAEIDRHNKELPTHANRIKELEAELAAAKEKYNHHHHHVLGLKSAPLLLPALFLHQ